jgi:hypothetical protein
MISRPGKFYETGPAENSVHRQILPGRSARRWFLPELKFSKTSSWLLVNATRAAGGTLIA